ncbi:copper(I)-binding protein [Azospirillum lipoferum]|uniref:Copper chaperone PCu(A)C n=1 Tax=Azospirillum lipoferum TaxID=193 RepID=A0A5A9GDM2_AZOLI|nr:MULTISPECIES: copper chaperone PCu(A)C [Azospirillum]KAA0592598.1 copper chaperone PCu(A)C [Azospirillum lipoferum]MCP1614410.1 copper(I)-binding protein [Azospirillum lipoferum]MDW5532758.1 copper chaperone PCu(A)C [Azospirillum sp. NL1]
MKHILGIAAALALFGAGTALAHSYKAGPIEIGHPWARATAPSAPNGGAYLSLTNTGTTEDHLVAASTPAAEKAELHTHLNENGVMKMREVPPIAIAPGETVKFAPGGLHIMLLGLKQPLEKGARIPMTLRFEKAGSVEVEIAVEAAGQAAPQAENHMGAAGAGHDHNAAAAQKQ